MELDYKMIGNRISELRKKKGMTQAVLAELSEIEPSHISHIERAATKLSLPTLVAIANALEVTLDELVYNNLSKSTSSQLETKSVSFSFCICTPLPCHHTLILFHTVRLQIPYLFAVSHRPVKARYGLSDDCRRYAVLL